MDIDEEEQLDEDLRQLEEVLQEQQTQPPQIFSPPPTAMELDVKEVVPMTSVDFTGRPIKDIADLNNTIKSLTWRNLSNDELVVFFTIYNNPQLESLDLSRTTCKESQLLIKQIPITFVVPNLRILNLSGTIRLTRKMLWRLIKKCPHLIDLDVSCTALTDVRPLSKLPLVLLNVSNNYLNDIDAKYIHRFMTNITSLDLSQNDLTNEGIQTTFYGTRLRYVRLNVGNQKTHHIRAEVLDDIQSRLLQMNEKEEKTAMEKQKIIMKNLVLVPSDNTKDVYDKIQQHPNTTHLMIHELSITWDDFNFFSVRKLKHLTSLSIVGANLDNNKTSHYLFHHPTIVRIHFMDVEISPKIAKLIARNKNLEQLTVSHNVISTEALMKLVEHTSISMLEFYYVRVKEITQSRQPDLEQKISNQIVNAFLKNSALQDIYPGYLFIGFTPLQIQIIRDHLKENRQRLKMTKQIIPLLAATQLGGPLRHSAIDILPIVYKFLGNEPEGGVDEPPQLAELSQQIEPVQPPVGVKRTEEEIRQTKPLPPMFESLMPPPSGFTSLAKLKRK